MSTKVTVTIEIETFGDGLFIRKIEREPFGDNHAFILMQVEGVLAEVKTDIEGFITNRFGYQNKDDSSAKY
jgi:hypothetical protein